MTLAALRKFGLLEEVPGDGGRQLALTRLAVTILLSESPEQQEDRLRALREAALLPESHRHLWEKWGPNLPQDSAVRLYLHLERKFNRTVLDVFIKQYKKTIAFAELDHSEAHPAQRVEAPAPSDDEEKARGASSESGTTRVSNEGLSRASLIAGPSQALTGSTSTGDQAGLGTIELTVPLKDGINFYLRIPEHRSLKRGHFEQFKVFVDFLANSRSCDELAPRPVRAIARA